jgi:hypothetical protein
MHLRFRRLIAQSLVLLRSSARQRPGQPAAAESFAERFDQSGMTHPELLWGSRRYLPRRISASISIS